MIRSLYSGVSGLKTHQTKMDVVGNNIANVNTTAYKSKSINFTDLLYQTTQGATGPNAETQISGQNPRQIGLGVKTGAISTSITTQGANQTTGNPFDLKITGESFFIVSDGTSTYFTRDGSFNTDALGYLTMANTGYSVMGWPADEEGTVTVGTVQRLRVDTTSSYEAAATTQAYMSGIIDKFDEQLDTTDGRQINLQVYDNLGYAYNVKFGVKPVIATTTGTKNAVRTERQFTLPATIALVDNSTMTYTMANGADLTSTVIPDGLLDAIKAQADATHIAGTAESIDITLNDAFFAVHTDVTLDAASVLRGQVITVGYSGTTGYEGFTADGTSLGILDVPDTTLTALYGTLPTTIGGAAGTATATAATINVTQKTYTDGTESQYEYSYGGTAITFEYADIAKLLATNSTPIVLSQVTVSEDVTTTEKQDGQFTIEVLGMTDSNGDVVDITALGDTTQSLVYSTDNGTFSYVGAAGSDTFTLALQALGGNFENVTIDMSATKNVDNSKVSTIGATKGEAGTGTGAGRKIGTMTGVSIGTDGTITASYSNSMTRVLGQIAVANFANASGLANVGNNCYEATSNSGDFDGIGSNITADGSNMTSGCLEMSNVDLSTEFTEMITCQRGFQANSRIITVSDTLLEELVNLKR